MQRESAEWIDGEDFGQERGRLFRLCLRWTGNTQAAEDITQETLLLALRRKRSNAPPREWSPYLTGIARRLCQKWAERQARDRERFTTWEDVPETVFLTPNERFDPLQELLTTERESLLDRALQQLPHSARTLLTAYYVNEKPLIEIAAHARITENAAAVRLHRSREALARVLATDLRTEADAHGLLDPDTAQGWRETALFCCRCGTTRLRGRFEWNSATNTPEFILDCPTCPGVLSGMTTFAAPMNRVAVLGQIKGFRSGLNRVNRWWQTYLTSALDKETAACVVCGQSASVHTQPENVEAGLCFHCLHCRATTFFITPTGLLYHSEAFQTFWKQQGRVRNRAEKSIVCEGRPSVLTTFTAVASSARIEMVFDRATLQVLRTETVA